METSYTELEDLEGAAYQDPKISESCADPFLLGCFMYMSPF